MKSQISKSPNLQIRFYLSGAFGGHYDHRHLDRPVAAGGAGRAGSGPAGTVPNNVKQIGLAVLNYESLSGVFPPSGISMKSGNYGFSWIGRILPYAEQENIYDQLDLVGTPANNSIIGWLGGGGNP